jgi:serine/threonine protein kinase
MTGPVEWFDSKSMIADAGTHPADPINVTPGSILRDRYRIVAHLGAGGIGQVFEAVDLANGDERVTLKVVAVNLRHQPDAFHTLLAAVRRTQHLNHPNIVSIRNIDRHGDSVFIVMEPLRGRWLSGLIREVRGQGLSHGAAWPIISGIANGLAYAHSHGVVHADLSPHAVFLCDDGTAKIMCFELVNAVPTSNESLDVLDTLTLRAYTEAYATDPWAQYSKPHPADDLYPLGVIAYEMLTGMHPFQRSSMAVARQKGMTYVPISGLNRRARKLLERCLSFERRDRPQSANRFVKYMQPSLLERVWSAAS